MSININRVCHLLLAILFFGGALAHANQTPPNWFNIGYSSSQQGLLMAGQNHLSDAEYQQYLQGYKQGKLELCGEEGISVGAKRPHYQGICQDENFNEDYQRGKKFAHMASKLNQL